MWRNKRGQDARDNRHVREQRDDRMMVVAFLFRLNAVRRRAPGAVRWHPRCGCRSRRHVDQLGLRRCVWLRLGPFHGVFGSGLWLDVLGEKLIVDMECRGLVPLFITMSSSEPSTTERASVVVACVWMQLLKLWKIIMSQDCKYDVLRGWMKHSTTWGKGAFMGARVASLTWMLAIFERRIHACLSCLQHVVQSGRELQDRVRRCPAVLWRDVQSVQRPGLLQQDSVCLARVHDRHHHVQRTTVHAEGDRECSGVLRVALQLSLFDAAAARPDLMHRPEAARGLVDLVGDL